MDEKQWIGMGLAIMGALLWGLSGTSVQFLENAKHLNVEWLLEVRLLVAGLLTILLAYVQDGMRIFDIFKNPKDFGKLLIFGILGIALAQYTYFSSYRHFRCRCCYCSSICSANNADYLSIYTIF